MIWEYHGMWVWFIMIELPIWMSKYRTIDEISSKFQFWDLGPFFGVIGIPQSSKNNTPDLIKAMFLFGLDIEMAQNWEDFVPSLCFIPAIPRAHPDGLKFFFHPQSHQIVVVSPWAHLWLWESGILVTGPEMGGSREVSTRETLGSRIHPKTSHNWNLPKKKHNSYGWRDSKDGNASLQRVSGCFRVPAVGFTGWFFVGRWLFASQVKVERFQRRICETACRTCRQ